MKELILDFIHTYLWWTYRPIKDMIRKEMQRRHSIKETARLDSLEINPAQDRVFYLGITEQPNLGDMAQHYCILKWISANYADRELVKFESSVVTDPRYGFIEKFKRLYRPQDIIVFQSGYCTQDLGGDHELMHRLIIDAIPTARIIMMPQTIFFLHEENRKRTADSYDQACNMLFLARDRVSYDMAKEMFPSIHVELFPDIVTTLIGTLDFKNEREGFCLCCRNDGEKLYSDKDIKVLSSKLSKVGPVTKKDTQGLVSYRTIRENLKYYIENEIESYSHYKVTITDRYHGTIFSLAAGTPVIILKTTDHKVTTGADWFKGIYDDYVTIAKDLDEAYELAEKIANKPLANKLAPYFTKKYYNNLKTLFEC